MEQPSVHPLTAVRIRYNLTRKRLGKEIGVGESTIFRAERYKPVSAEIRRLLCDYFGMTASELGLNIAEHKHTDDHVSEAQEHPCLSLPSQPVALTSASRPSLPSALADIIGKKPSVS